MILMRGAAGLSVVFALKLAVFMQLRDHPLLQPDAGLDTTAYAELAGRVLAGDLGLGPGVYYVSPFYIYFLAAGLAVLDSFTAVRLLQILLGTASVGFIFLATREWFGERAAWIAGGAASLTGLFTFYESLILQASVDAFLTSAALATLALGLRRNAGGWLLLAGIVFGLAALNRPNIPFGVAGVALALLLSRRFWPVALIVGGLLVGMAPAAIRNAVVAHQWSLASSHGGLNFYIGNNAGATGFYQQVPGISPTIEGQQRDVRRVADRAAGRQVTDAEASDYFFSLAREWIREHPGRAAVLFVRKLGYVFHAQHVALPHSYPFYAYDAGTLLRFLPIGPWLLVPLGLVGLVLPALRGPAFAKGRASPGAWQRPGIRTDYVAWVAFVPGYAIGVAAFFVSERYRLPLLVPLCAGCGAAVDVATTAIRQRRIALLTVPAVMFATLLALTNRPLGLHDGRWEEGLRMAQRLVILGRYQEADEWVHRFEGRGPRPGATHYGVGAQLLLVNQPDRALSHLQTANELTPGQPQVEYALGQALLKSDRAVEAIPYLRRGFEAGIELPLGGYDLAVALHAAGDFPGAVDVIRRIRPPAEDDDPEAWSRLGRLAARAQAPDVAEPYFRRAVEIRPGQASTRQQLGLNLVILGRCDEAVRELSEATRLDPRDPDTLSHLAYCELERGNIAAARAHAATALSLDAANTLAKQVQAAVAR